MRTSTELLSYTWEGGFKEPAQVTGPKLCAELNTNESSRTEIKKNPEQADGKMVVQHSERQIAPSAVMGMDSTSS
jgi:hypothetical protein